MQPFKPFKATLEEEEAWKNAPTRRIFRSRGDIFSRAYARQDISIQELLDMAYMSGWRIVRSHALAKMQINPNEPLANLGSAAQWANPMPDNSPPMRSALSEKLADIWAGLPLLPQRGQETEFVSAVLKTAALLRIEQPHLYGIDDPRTVLRFFPRRDDVIGLEYAFVSKASAELLDGGHTHALRELQSRDGLSRAEVVALVPLAKTLAVESITVDPEQDQRIMIAKTESAIKRAQDAMDIRSEIAGLKHLAFVQGLGKIEPSDPITVFADIIREVAKDEPRQLEQKVDYADYSVVNDNLQQEA